MPTATATAEDSLTDAEAEMVNDNLGLVRNLANESKCRWLDPDDRFQAGCIGLIEAVQLYDPSLGSTLATHAAPWIEQAIRRAAAKAKPMTGLADLGEGGLEPLDAAEAPDLDATDAERPRAKAAEAHALKALRAATRGGKEATAPHWRDARTGEPIRSGRTSADEDRAMSGLRLLPLFPPVGFGRESECPHDGPIPRGSRVVCMVCSRSGLDGIAIPRPEDVKPLPRDPKPIEPKPEKQTRKQRRAGKARKLAKAG